MAQGHPSSRRVHAFILAGMWLCFHGLRVSCLANPIGGIVVTGDAQIQNSVPGLTSIVQHSNRAVIDWQSFSIAAGEHTNFIVPDATSATLNRVLGYDPSIVNGRLTSNGNLFLINSNGIVFGQGAVVDVGGLTASTLNVSNEAFMAGGEMNFQGTSQAAVKNAGMIQASGDVFLIGYQVSNSGTIRAPNGTVGLAAGSDVLIMPVGDERVIVRNAAGPHKKTGVSNSGTIEANVAELKAHNGNVYAMAIRNTGRVAATGVTKQGGRILLTANGGKIQNSGTLVARALSGNGGQVKINAGQGGKVIIKGRVDADGPTGTGGQISINGEQVEIRRAIAVSADGATGGGVLEIGSNAPAGSDDAEISRTMIGGMLSASSSDGMGGQIHLGGRTIAIEEDARITVNGAIGGGVINAGSGGGLVAASQVMIDCGAVLSANAIENGNGGQIVVMSDDQLTFQGSLQARGGQSSGDGGQAVLSAGQSLRIDQLSDRVDLTASAGDAGGLRIQSNEFVIAAASTLGGGEMPANTLNAADISCFLESANLTIQTQIVGGGSGNIYVLDTVAWNSVQGLTLISDCDVLLLCGDDNAGSIHANGAGDVTIQAARFVLLETGTAINTTTGHVRIDSNQRLDSIGSQLGITVAGSITTKGGNVSLTGQGVTVSDGLVDSGDGSILVDGNGRAIVLIGSLTTANQTSAAVRIIDASTASLGNITTGAAGTVTLGGAASDQINGAVTQTGVISAGTVTGNVGSSVNLDGNNRVANLGTFSSNGDFTFNDANGGLNVTGNVETRGGAAMVTTAGGVLALGGSSISSAGGKVSLTGVGVTSTGGTVDAGSGTITVDGNDGAIDLAGSLTTTNETTQATRIIDATTVSLGNITVGATGVVTLGGLAGDELSGALKQTGVIIAGTITGNTGSSVALGGSNTVSNLGAFTSNGDFTFNDTAGGLNVTGSIETRGGAATITTAGGALALGNQNIATSGGNVNLAGTGVSSTGGAVNAGGGTITVDGNDGAIQLAGSLTTTNGTASAVRIVDAKMASLGNITTGTTGTVTLGGAAGDNISGAVTQTGVIDAGTLVGNGGSTVTLDGNNKVVNLGELTSTDAFTFNDANGGLNVTGKVSTQGGAVAISTAGGALALGNNDITTSGGNVSLKGQGVTSIGGTVDAGGGTIAVDGEDGAIDLVGSLTTTNGTTSAVRITDATTVSLGNITTGATGTVTLGAAAGDNLSGAVKQTGIIKAGTVTGNTGGPVALGGNNTVASLGAFTSNGDLTFNDTTEGLRLTGKVSTNGGAANLATSGGALALGNNDITTSGGNASLTGQGVTSIGGTVDAGGGTIEVDGNDGAINLVGALATTNDTAAAVRIIDATTVSVGNITTGATGTVTLGGAAGDNLSGAVKQTGIINAGTVVGNTGSTVDLDGNNTVAALGAFKTNGNFSFNDTTGGLNVTGSVETRGGAAKITSAGGALALGGNDIKTEGGSVNLSAEGVTSTGGTVDAGAGTIAVDGNGGAINLAGSLTTTNSTADAVRIRDASAASLGNITTGATATVTLENMNGEVSQTGRIKTGNLALSGDGSFTLTGASNEIETVATEDAVGSLSLVNSTDLSIGTAGLTASGNIAITVSGMKDLMIGNDVASQGGAIALSASGIEVNGASVSSSGGAPVTLTADRFMLANQPLIAGTLVGNGGMAQLTLDDSNLTTGQSYTIGAGSLTAGSRSYAFQGVSSVSLDLGEGNDTSDTNFFTFDQFLNAGGGTNQLFVAGSPVTSSPLARPGFGTITFSGFELAPAPVVAQAPPATTTPNAPPVGSVVLQTVTPGASSGGGGGSSETNNFNSTSTTGASPGGVSVAAGPGASAPVMPGGGTIAGATSVIGQSLGLVSTGGGAPPSFGTQSQMNSATSATVESELNAALGGDGTMGVRSSTGLVSVNPGSAPPSASSLAQLEGGMNLLALSELSFGAIGVTDVTVTPQLGIQALTLGGAPPVAAVLQNLIQVSDPESFSQLFRALGGDGTAPVQSDSAGIRVDLGGSAPPLTEARLLAVLSPGAFGELSLALGGTGEYLVNELLGLAMMDPSGTPAGKGTKSAVLAVLAAPSHTLLSAALGADGAVLVLSQDGIVSIACDALSPGPLLVAILEAAIAPTSLEELDAVTR